MKLTQHFLIIFFICGVSELEAMQLALKKKAQAEAKKIEQEKHHANHPSIKPTKELPPAPTHQSGDEQDQIDVSLSNSEVQEILEKNSPVPVQVFEDNIPPHDASIKAVKQEIQHSGSLQPNQSSEIQAHNILPIPPISLQSEPDQQEAPDQDIQTAESDEIIPDIEHFEQEEKKAENQPVEKHEDFPAKALVVDSQVIEKNEKKIEKSPERARKEKRKKKLKKEKKKQERVENLIDSYFDKKLVDPKLDLTKESPVNFYKNDFDLPDKSKIFLKNYGYSLAIGEENDFQDVEASTLKILQAWIKQTFAHIVLYRRDGQVDNCFKTKELTGKSADDLNFKNQKITQVKAKLNNKKSGFDLTTWHPNDNIQKEIPRIVSLDGVEGTCIAIHPQNQQVYVGCKDGSIKIFSAETNKCLNILRYHKTPIKAIAFIDDGDLLVSTEDDGQVFIQDVHDNRPRASLDKVAFSKNYLVNKPPEIIRSHIGGKGLGWGYGIDGVYSIPKGYISARCFDLRHIGFMYILKKIQNNQLRDPEKFKSVCNSWVINTFEPSVTTAIRKFLEEKSESLGIQYPENELLMKD